MENSDKSKAPFFNAPETLDLLSRTAWNGSLANLRYYLARSPAGRDAVSGGRTPLLWAISAGRDDATDFLLKEGANLRKKTADGDSALACAVWSGNAKLVQLMLDKGFDPGEKNTHGKSAFDWARELGKADVLELMQAFVLADTHARTAARQQRLKDMARQRKNGIGF